MKNILLLLLLNTAFIFSQDIHVPIDTIIKTYHETIIKGKKIKYTAETGMQPVWDNDGKPIASLFYTYYKRNLSKDSETKESHRPIIISFNGGPIILLLIVFSIFLLLDQSDGFLRLAMK